MSLRRIRSPDTVPKLVKLAAARSAQLLNAAGIASACGLTRPTVHDHLILLRHIFLLATYLPCCPPCSTSEPSGR